MPRSNRPDELKEPQKASPRQRRTTSGTTSRTKRSSAEVEVPLLAASAAPRLLRYYRDEVLPHLKEEFGYPNSMSFPKLEKIVLNIGLGEALQNPRAMENATRDLTLITGQKPVVTKARKSIAGFKIRAGMPVGLMTTLRGNRMYEFYDRLVNASLPRIRDFRGLSRRSFDGRGNFALGIREQVIFPEIDYNNIDRLRGLQILVVTTAKSDREALRLLELMGMPFVRETPATST